MQSKSIGSVGQSVDRSVLGNGNENILIWILKYDDVLCQSAGNIICFVIQIDSFACVRLIEFNQPD